MVKRINPLVLKLVVLSLLLFMSSLPRCSVDSIIAERQSYRAQAVDSVVKGWAERHSFGRVSMNVPYSYEYEVETVEDKNKKKTKKIEVANENSPLDPVTEAIQVSDSIESRKRGIFEIPIYKADVVVEGSFEIPKDVAPKVANEKLDDKEQTMTFATPHSASISDFSLEIDGRKRSIRRSNEGLIASFRDGGFAPGQRISYRLRAKLIGYGGLDIAGVADELSVSVVSAWPHPSFRGQLPVDQDIRPDGFSAKWKLMQSSANQQISIDYIEPVNVYSQASRALKYGFLITLLVLSALFLMETLGKTPIHGMQYMFMTLPLACFYVLLVALSEHIGFSGAYVAASGAVIGLIFVYFKGIGASFKQSAGLAGVLSGLYALVMTMLSSEDYALLIGAISLFLCLAAIMLLTRKLDWSKRLGSSKVEAESVHA